MKSADETLSNSASEVGFNEGIRRASELIAEKISQKDEDDSGEQ